MLEVPAGVPCSPQAGGRTALLLPCAPAAPASRGSERQSVQNPLISGVFSCPQPAQIQPVCGRHSVTSDRRPRIDRAPLSGMRPAGSRADRHRSGGPPRPVSGGHGRTQQARAVCGRAQQSQATQTAVPWSTRQHTRLAHRGQPLLVFAFGRSRLSRVRAPRTDGQAMPRCSATGVLGGLALPPAPASRASPNTPDVPSWR